MKRKSKNLLTLMLAGALCAATVGGTVGFMSASAEETTSTVTKQTYALSSIFDAVGNGSVGSVAGEAEGAKGTTAFTFKPQSNNSTDSKIGFNNGDLALKWYKAKGQAEYMSLEFAFEAMNFTDASIVLHTDPAAAVENDIAINTIKFVNNEGTVSVKVFAGEDEPADGKPIGMVEAKQKIKVSLGAGEAYGEFKVLVNDQEVGSLTNVGANYATEFDFGNSSSDDDVYPLEIKATPAGTDDTVILLSKLNGQSFDNVENNKVEDDAAPVLVLNEEVKGFLLGTAFNLDYKKLDVLKSSVSSEEKLYYQYNPADTSVEESSITTSVYFQDTVYYVNDSDETQVSATPQEGYTKTTVYKANNGEEYVSIVFKLGDGAFKDQRYELAWYVEDGAYLKEDVTIGEGESADTRDYIVLNRNDVGPKYTHIDPIAADEENDVPAKNSGTDSETYKTEVADYQDKVDEAAEKIYAGTGATISLPSIDKLISDANNGYNSLLFTISYKTPTSSAPSTTSATNKKGNALTFPTTREGTYEFKIFATDAAGNPMQYYLDGELVDVTSSNVWDIEEIPTFTFVATNKGLGIPTSEDGSTLEKKNLGDSYTLSTFKVLGANEQATPVYTLYKIDLGKVEGGWTIAELNKEFSKIKFNYVEDEENPDEDNNVDLNEKIAELLKELYPNKTINDIDADELNAVYVKAYAQLVAGLLGITEDAKIADFEKVFDKIEEYDSRLAEDEGDNIYNWNASSRRFTCADEGLYLIIADHYDADMIADRAVAYKLIEVREDTLDEGGYNGPSWLENNLTSIILFSIAGVLLVAMIVLIFVKPSDEKLEDVDKKAKKTVKKK